MVVTSGTNLAGRRPGSNIRPDHLGFCRGVLELSVRPGGTGPVRRRDHTAGKQAMTPSKLKQLGEANKIEPPIHLVCDSKFRKWMWENAPMMAFLTVMFLISWVVTILAAIWGHGAH